MRKLVFLSFVPAIIVLEIVMVNFILSIISQANDMAVFAGVLFVTFFILINYLLIKLTIKIFKK